MRILVISDLLPPRMLGGFELACLNISRGLRERGHDVRILTSPTDRVAPDQHGWVDRSLALDELFVNVWAPDEAVRFTQRHASRVSNIGNTLIVLDRVREFRPDHVLFFNLVGIGGLALIDAIDRLGVPWTMNLGDNVPGNLLEDLPAEVADRFGVGDGLFSRGRTSIVSQTLLEEVQAGGVVLGETRVIPRGVVHNDVPRTRRHQEDGVTRFVAAGVLSPHKGVDIMLDAARALLDAGRDAFRLEIYGGGLLDHYRERIVELGLVQHVAAPGPVSQRELLEIHARSDAFVFPTWSREPGASVPIEAASVGCIPIMTGDCGPAERMIDGVHCVKITRDVPSLTAAMTRVMDGELDLASMAVAGRRLARGDLAFATSLDRLETLLIDGTPERTAPRTLDFDDLARRFIQADDDALRAAYAAARKDDPMPPIDVPAPVPPLSRFNLVGRLIRRYTRPLVSGEFARQRAELQQEVDRLDAQRAAIESAQAELDAAAAKLHSELEIVRKDLLATNHRINWIESSSAPDPA